MKSFFVRYRYELITSVCGATVMIVELVGARMLAPYVGSSLYVWTTMIGVILGALSFGYWYGGKLADQNPNDEKLMKIVTLASFCILVAMIFHSVVLGFVVSITQDVRVASLLAAIVLFAPAAVLLGIESPYVARLRLKSLATAGESIGRLYAAGTFGSIIGTFLAGYWLISWFGNQTLGILVVLVLLCLSFFIDHKKWRLLRVIGIVVTILFSMSASSPFSSQVIADIDTPYNRYLVTESDQQPVLRALVTDPFSTQSAQYVGRPDILVAKYTKNFFDISEKLQPTDILVIGGGAFTYPQAFSRANPESYVTVVEIDEKLADISKEYFGLVDSQNMTIIHEDGRVYLNQSNKKFDVIYMDAFSSLTPPYQLTTTETNQHEKRLLQKNGAVVTNAIASLQNDAYLAALISTQRQTFRYVEVYQVIEGSDPQQKQNVIIVATDSQATSKAIESVLGKNTRVSVKSGSILTDDHAPVEQLINSR